MAAHREPLTLHARGRRLHAERIGLGPHGRRGPTLVFLHEGLGCIGFWRDFPDVLCRRLGVDGLVYDRWGHGASEAFDRPRTSRYLHDEAQRFLPDVLAEAGIELPVLVGHSDGGTIALLYAAAFPDRPLAVVAEAAHVLVEEATLAGIRTAQAAWQAGRLRETLERFHGAKASSVFHAWADCWLSPGFRTWNIEAELAAVRAPVLALQGAADEYGTPDQLERIAAGVAGPVRTVLLQGCAHVPHHQARAATLEAIVDFLDPLLLRDPVQTARAPLYGPSTLRTGGAGMGIQRFETSRRMSQAVVHGDRVFLAGVVAKTKAGGSMAEQTRDVLAEVDRLLGLAGTDKTKLLSANIWITDMSRFGEMNEVWDAWVPEGCAPARATVEAKLAAPQYVVEIMVTAAR